MKSFIGIVFSMVVTAGLVTQAQMVKVDGSSTVFPLTEAVAEEFQKFDPKIRVTVGISGTGGGFKKFCRGDSDVQNASRPIEESEMLACKKNGIRFLELPVAFDAIAVVVHPSNSFVADITVEELKKAWEPSAQGQIKKWNQIRSTWPSTPIAFFGAGSDSGTFDYFTEAINGKSKSSRGDYTASEDDNTLVMGVSREKNALGYVPLHYFEENSTKMKAIPVIYKGKKQSPSKQSVISGQYAPLSRPLFIYISEKSLKRPEVKKFAEFYLMKSKNLAEEIQMIPLPEATYSLVQKNLKDEKWGTVFKGHSQVGMKIEDLFSREKN